MAIILASASPRRKQLLDQIGCSYTVKVSTIIEDNTANRPPAELAIANAAAKARDVAAQCNDSDIIIGADTIVVLDGQVFGKPADDQDARRMLSQLAGRVHQVISGIAIVTGKRVYSDSQLTLVRIRSLEQAEIERYIATGEPMDKAGAYAVQGIGTLLVESIQGCYNNVVGLPLVALNRLMMKAGVRLL